MRMTCFCYVLTHVVTSPVRMDNARTTREIVKDTFIFLSGFYRDTVHSCYLLGSSWLTFLEAIGTVLTVVRQMGCFSQWLPIPKCSYL